MIDYLTIPNSLSDKLCDDIIHKFDSDDRVDYGKINMGDVDTEVKRCKELFISILDNWRDLDNQVFNASVKGLSQYREYINELYDADYLLGSDNSDQGYRVKRYDIGEDYFHWHHDLRIDENRRMRSVAFIWYLNDVEEGGETEFSNGLKIRPEKGKLLLFPSTWNNVHRGNTPISNTKYAITSFLYSSYD
ncbi:hypothetical protein Syn7803US13_26 [Synechococcus phage ACG-2014f]|jgi:hypothetical protein|uniref:Fe2OG dioxygenase domain-containing protein n=4 Tax=Atlauavirus TaxID=2733092 RepID=A0A0E3G3Y4_9CAUD|nr:2OG-Fe(II) oxygenase [Synechococcus phage ACG-2014f]YP_009778180.1 2OG-Fe(II) oxygenase [Synechococcus phage ACG-2014f_Syn7803C7]YP_009778467.1 2OG-Fe(II) oxygenase [Synechococcus phage ACG-2014f_Syn7803C8]YP_009778753.1 2OG-Fe(II) oxygenase [Synechococcus phage ACG-2014f_Syn7803US26]AIX16551.1 hypothetical protein Syn7803C58_26 [Synechococcus phage ACG-2014f]AIX18325.1 hypothetical protein Syn7803C6_26 [Synechococcus phage ACG-2014f]AIX19917.1 hypothetical protein Syn7803C7_26 [Synechococ